MGSYARPCRESGCLQFARDGEKYCAAHLHSNSRTERSNYAAHELYNRSSWRSKKYGLRALILRRDPLCTCEEGETCHGKGNEGRCREMSTEVDHIIDHHGDEKLFYAHENCRGLCAACHARKTAKKNFGVKL